MPTDKHFIIAVGGTGMRCVEAFTHLCAAGMCDGKEFDILLIDTDSQNGNKSQTELVIEKYMTLKGGPEKAKPTADTFFSAKLNVHRYSPEYSTIGRRTYAELSKLALGETAKNRALSDLFFSSNVQEFNLEHGYRAQTHVGSHLMFHSILDAARTAGNEDDAGLVSFVNSIATAGETARVFIFGSIFGGTGASAIPVLPRALERAIDIARQQKIDENTRWGCALLTQYFEFDPPTNEYREQQRIVAESNNFARNSQAALKFYSGDSTVARSYTRVYHVGFPRARKLTERSQTGEPITGGAQQKNQAHVAELLCAAAALDFFEHEGESSAFELVHRSAEMEGTTFHFRADDFVGAGMSERFELRIGALFALALLQLASEGGSAVGVKKISEKLASEYVNIPPKELKALDDYLHHFAFSLDGETVRGGWLYQIKESTGNAGFLYSPKAFSDDPRELRGFEVGELFGDEKRRWKRAGRLPFTKESSYTVWRDAIQERESVKPDDARQRPQTLMERFLAHSFNTLTELYGN